MGLLGGILVPVAAQSNSPMRSAASSSASLSEQRESVDELLQLGIEQFRQYNLKEAEKTFQRVLALRQQQAAGLNLLYYQCLQKGDGRSEALRQVQLEMMQAPAYQHPYYWASFIFSGDWSGIGGL